MSESVISSVVLCVVYLLICIITMGMCVVMGKLCVYEFLCSDKMSIVK